MTTEHSPPSTETCRQCGVVNVLDNRAAKTNCPHFCFTCASTEKRLVACKNHPEGRKP